MKRWLFASIATFFVALIFVSVAPLPALGICVIGAAFGALAVKQASPPLRRQLVNDLRVEIVLAGLAGIGLAMMASDVHAPGPSRRYFALILLIVSFGLLAMLTLKLLWSVFTTLRRH